MSSTTSRRSFLRTAAMAAPAMALPVSAALAGTYTADLAAPPARVVTAQERVNAAFQELKDAVTALGPDSHVDYAIHNKVGARSVWLITAKDGPAPAVI